MRGFTLIETLVAVTILLIGVLGPLTIAANGIADGLYAKNQITANFLAREALEAVMHIRNSNVIAAQPWNTGLDQCASGCSLTLDLATPMPRMVLSPASCTNINRPCDLAYDRTAGFFRQPRQVREQGSPVFTREVRARMTQPNDELQVTVTVSWFNRAVQRDFSLSSYVYRCGGNNEDPSCIAS